MQILTSELQTLFFWDYRLEIKNPFSTWNVKDMVCVGASCSVCFIISPFAKWGKQSLAFRWSSCAVSCSLLERAHALFRSVILSLAEIAEYATVMVAKLSLLLLARSIYAYRALTSHLHLVPLILESGDARYWINVEISLLVCPSYELTDKATRT